MILNISLRTDIVACYTDWLVDKLLHKDFIYSQNPRTKVTTAYSLKDVDEEEELANARGIRNVPVLIYYNEQDEEVKRTVGAVSLGTIISIINGN